MERLGVFVTRHPFKIILFVLILLSFPLSHITHNVFDISRQQAAGSHHNERLVQYQAFKEEFGNDESVVLAIKSDKIFSLDFLKQLRDLHVSIETTVPFIEDVVSLYNIRNTREERNHLITDDLLMPFPQTQEEIKRIREQAVSSPFYQKFLISAEGNMTTVFIKPDVYSQVKRKTVDQNGSKKGFADEQIAQKNRSFLTENEKTQIMDAVKMIVDRYKQQGMEIAIVASFEMNSLMVSESKYDRVGTLIPFLFLLGAASIVFLLFFKRITTVAYSLTVLFLSLTATVGIMAWSGIDVTLFLPIKLLMLTVVSLGASMYLLLVFFNHFKINGDARESVIVALKYTGVPIVISDILIAASMGSLMNSDIKQILDFAAFVSIGVLVSMLLNVMLMPSLLMVTSFKPKMEHNFLIVNRFSELFTAFSMKHYRKIIMVSVILTLLSLMASIKMMLSHEMVQSVKSGQSQHLSQKDSDDEKDSIVSVELIVDTGKENGWMDPVRLKMLDRFSAYVESRIDPEAQIGKVVSLATIVKEINHALNENNESSYAVPDDAKMIQEELLRFANSGSDDLENVVDTLFSNARITIVLPQRDLPNLLNDLEKKTKAAFPHDRVYMTGKVTLHTNAPEHSVTIEINRFMNVFIMLTPFMLFIMGRIRPGIYSMIPIMIPILFGTFMIALFHIPLDMNTLFGGLIVVAFCIEGMIHTMYGFRRLYLVKEEAEDALKESFFMTLPALLLNTIVLLFGLYLYAPHSKILISCIVIIAFFANLLLSSSMMVLIAKQGLIRK